MLAARQDCRQAPTVIREPWVANGKCAAVDPVQASADYRGLHLAG
jgi:hypothetical protein